MRISKIAAGLIIAIGLGLPMQQNVFAFEREVGFIIYGMPT